MLKAIGFIFVVYVVLSYVGGAPQHSVVIDGVPLTGWASSLLAVAAALAVAIMVFAILAALTADLVAAVIGLPLLLIALVVCAVFAPVLLRLPRAGFMRRHKGRMVHRSQGREPTTGR